MSLAEAIKLAQAESKAESERVIKRLESKNDDLSSKLDAEFKSRQKLERELHDSKNEIAKLKEDLDNEVKQKALLDRARKSVELQLEDAHTQIEIEARQRATADKLRRQAENEADRLREQVDALEEASQDLESNKTRLEFELEDAKKSVLREAEACEAAETARARIARGLAEIREKYDEEVVVRTNAERMRKKAEADYEDAKEQLYAESKVRSKLEREIRAQVKGGKDQTKAEADKLRARVYALEKMENNYKELETRLAEEQAKNDLEQATKRRLAEIELQLEQANELRLAEIEVKSKQDAKDNEEQRHQLDLEKKRLQAMADEISKKDVELKQREKDQAAQIQAWQERIAVSVSQQTQQQEATSSILSGVKAASDQVVIYEREWKELQLKADEAMHKFVQSKKTMQDKVETLENWLTKMELQVPLPEAKCFNDFLHAVGRMNSISAKKKCFISYAWNTDKQENTKLQASLIKLKGDLMKAGIEVMLDIHNMEGDVNIYMSSNIQQCDRVLLISERTSNSNLFDIHIYALQS